MNVLLKAGTEPEVPVVVTVGKANDFRLTQRLNIAEKFIHAVSVDGIDTSTRLKQLANIEAQVVVAPIFGSDTDLRFEQPLNMRFVLKKAIVDESDANEAQFWKVLTPATPDEPEAGSVNDTSEPQFRKV